MNEYLDNSDKKIKLAIMFVTGYGGEGYSWRFISNRRLTPTSMPILSLPNLLNRVKFTCCLLRIHLRWWELG